MTKLTLTLFLCFVSYLSFAQIKSENVELTDFIRDIIITQKDGDNMKQIWILPKEYWAIALKDSSYSNQETLDEIKMLLNDYLIISALDIDLGVLASMKSNEIEISLRDKNNKMHYPIEMENLDEDVTLIINVLKPTLAKMIGNLGEKLEFFVFKNIAADNTEILTPYKSGNISVLLNESEFKYKTPFGSLVKRKKCPVDGEKLNGNWDFCPWHGKKLKYK